jgi:hypothetical protein
MSVDHLHQGPTSVTSACLVSHHHTQACDMSVDHVHKWTLVYVLKEALRQGGLAVPGTKVKKEYLHHVFIRSMK